jgi:5'-3' exonuclease
LFDDNREKSAPIIWLLLLTKEDQNRSETRFLLTTKRIDPKRQRPFDLLFPISSNLLKAMHIPVIEKEGYEADDIIGTLAKQAEKEGFDVYMVTPDKDFAQLVLYKYIYVSPSRHG